MPKNTAVAPEPPPQLDLYKPIPVVTSTKDFERLLTGLGVTSVARENALQWFKQRNQADKQALKTVSSPAKGQTKRRNIITPGCDEVPPELLYRRPPFHYTEHYVKSCIHRGYIQPLELTRGDFVSYDIMTEDLQFLSGLAVELGISSDPTTEPPLALEENFLRLIDQFEHNTGLGSVIPYDIALGIAQSLPAICSQLPLRAIRAIYDHWIERRNELQKPLLRKYWGPAPANQPPNFCVFQTRLPNRERMALRRPRRSLQDASRRFDAVLTDLKKVEKIIKQMVRRDRQKMLLAELNGCIFEQLRRELQDPTYVNPYWLYLKRSKFSKILDRTGPTEWTENLSSDDNQSVTTSGVGKNLPLASLAVAPQSAEFLVRFREDAESVMWLDQLQVEGANAEYEVIVGPPCDVSALSNKRAVDGTPRSDSVPFNAYIKRFAPPHAVEYGPPLASLPGMVGTGYGVWGTVLHTMRQCRLMQAMVGLSGPLPAKAGGRSALSTRTRREDTSTTRRAV